MRILHAADFGGTAPGGFVPLIAALARLLRARGDAFALIVPRVAGATWHGLVRDAGADLHVVDGVAEAARIARAWRPDVAHVHFFGWEIAITSALWPSRAQIFWHAHSTSLRGGIGVSPRSLFKYRVAGARVARHVAVSQAVAGELVARGAPERRIVVVPNAIDTARFRPPAGDERRIARAALGLAPGERAILFYGRDPHIKGADILADALRALPGTAVIAVATPDATRAHLAERARLIAVERTDDVRPLLWAADALAMPSRGEGSPLAFLEALASGLPIAASGIPALREAGAGRPGVFYARSDEPAAFAAALAEALGSARLQPPAGGDGLAAWARAIAGLYAGNRDDGFLETELALRAAGNDV